MKTLILGFDAFDPTFFENLQNLGKLPNLSNLMGSNGTKYSQFSVSNPPQSEVSWTSIATGLNPGEHGMFDFVHRNPNNYSLNVSLLPTGKSMGGTQFVRPTTARTIFDVAADRGYPATSLWWPATFPARPEVAVRTLPGLGTPDIQGRLGIGAYYSTDPDLPEKMGKTPVHTLTKEGPDLFRARLYGPMIKSGEGADYASLEVKFATKDDHQVDAIIGKQLHKLSVGVWSPIIELRFKLSWIVSVHAITRIVVTQVTPHLQFYALPLQLHPLRSPWRYGTPTSFVKNVWKTSGPFLTLGWPQDTTGLEDGCITDGQFLDLCNSIYSTRENLLMHQLNTFNEGLLASIFDSMDRIQHMFWHSRPDIIEEWYLKLDRLVGNVKASLASRPDKPTRLLIVSDHGFNNFNYKANLNRWLIQNNYISSTEEKQNGDLKDVDWSRSSAYAVGLNSLYLNLIGRERDGIVSSDEKISMSKEICQKLESWNGPDGRPVVNKAFRNDETFTGALSSHGPDILVGYSPGYRASSETGLGAWSADAIERNLDHWGADHCIDPAAVPGVIFSNHDLSNFPNPSYKDIPALAIDATPDARGATPPPMLSDEDQEQVEERLKSLGYL